MSQLLFGGQAAGVSTGADGGVWLATAVGALDIQAGRTRPRVT